MNNTNAPLKSMNELAELLKIKRAEEQADNQPPKKEKVTLSRGNFSSLGNPILKWYVGSSRMMTTSEDFSRATARDDKSVADRFETIKEVEGNQGTREKAGRFFYGTRLPLITMVRNRECANMVVNGYGYSTMSLLDSRDPKRTPFVTRPSYGNPIFLNAKTDFMLIGYVAANPSGKHVEEGREFVGMAWHAQCLLPLDAGYNMTNVASIFLPNMHELDASYPIVAITSSAAKPSPKGRKEGRPEGWTTSHSPLIYGLKIPSMPDKEYAVGFYTYTDQVQSLQEDGTVSNLFPAYKEKGDLASKQLNMVVLELTDASNCLWDAVDLMVATKIMRAMFRADTKLTRLRHEDARNISALVMENAVTLAASIKHNNQVIHKPLNISVIS